MDNIVSIQDLKVDLLTTRGIVHAVRGIDLDIHKGEIHGLVGESGCGKTMTAKSIMRLHDEQKIMYSGKILFNGEDVLAKSKRELRHLRGKYISMVFQDPMVTLNPVFTVGDQITETLHAHLHLQKEAARKQAISLLEKVGIHPAERRVDQYPFEFSGGQLQRIMIAIAISCSPDLLIADESTTALDVTIQAQILDMMKSLQQGSGMSMLMITHNFGVVAEICDRASVMYAGKAVETSDVNSLFQHPLHPYTQALIESIPKSEQPGTRLVTIPGSPPDLRKKIAGCSFAPRCKYATEKCRMQEPPMIDAGDGHRFACHIGS